MNLMTRRFALSGLGIGVLWYACRRSFTSGKVEVRFRVIRYSEPAGFIELGWEPLEGQPPVAYAPSLRRWRAEMPDWARNRRDEILPEIKRQTRHMNFTWEEYD
jgi:hypothetical protein